MGVFGATVVTSVTAQNTQEVISARPVEPELVAAQLRAVLGDIGCDAGKLGMLSNGEVAEAVSETLQEFAPFPLVVDPVLRSTSGRDLFAPADVKRFVDKILPRTTLLTPNLDELARLAGVDREQVQPFAGRVEAAEALIAAGASAVLVKGAHALDLMTGAAGESGSEGERGRGAGGREGVGEVHVVDLLHDGERVHRFQHAWIDTVHTHGTGCTLSAAIAAGLALGLPLVPAVERGRQHLLTALRLAVAVGKGVSPVNHGHVRWTP